MRVLLESGDCDPLLVPIAAFDYQGFSRKYEAQIPPAEIAQSLCGRLLAPDYRDHGMVHAERTRSGTGKSCR